MPIFINKNTGEKVLVTNPRHAAAFTLKTKVMSSDENLRDNGDPTKTWELSKDDQKDFKEFIAQEQGRGKSMYDENGRVRPSAIEAFTEAKAPQESREAEKQREAEIEARERARFERLRADTEKEARIRAEAEYKARIEIERMHADEAARKEQGGKRIDKVIGDVIDEANRKDK